MHAGPSLIRRHVVERSSIELTASLRANIQASQEAAAAAAVEGLPEDGDSSTPNGAHQQSTLPNWTSREDSCIYIPSIDWALSGLAEERSQYDITVKLFFLPGVSPARRCSHTKEAIDLVLRELKVPSVDLLILAFPGVGFKADDEALNDGRRDCGGVPNGVAHTLHGGPGPVEDMASMVKTWRTVEKMQTQGIIGRLGVSEFGARRLEEFLQYTRVRPSVNQINVRDCCTVPRSLTGFAKREQIELLTHNDCVDILPTGTLRELLGDGKDGVGLLSNAASGSIDDLSGRVEAQWVVKYTAVVRDRGVIENKGYFAAADLEGDQY